MRFNFSEIEESAELLLDLVRATPATPSAPAPTPPAARPAASAPAARPGTPPAKSAATEAQPRPVRPPPPLPVPPATKSASGPTTAVAEPKARAVQATPAAPKPTAPAPSPAATPAPQTTEASPAPRYRSERLEQALAAMCRRGGFAGALLADAGGLAVAEHKSPVDSSLVAAFTTVLASAAERAGTLLNNHIANHISLDIDYTSKAELRRFEAGQAPYHLVAICPQTCDARAEMEVTIPSLCSILAA